MANVILLNMISYHKNELIDVVDDQIVDMNTVHHKDSIIIKSLDNLTADHISNILHIILQ